MTLLSFRDALHVEWRVSEVTRAQLDAFRARTLLLEAVGVRMVSRPLLPGLEDGWLSFESWKEKRRLATYPAHWRALPASELARLCEQATLVRQRGSIPSAASLDGEWRTLPPLWPGWNRVDVVELTVVRRAIRACVRDGDGWPSDGMHRALRAFCSHLRQRGLGAQHAVAAFDAVWTSLVDAGTVRAPEAHALREGLVTMAVEAFEEDARRTR